MITTDYDIIETTTSTGYGTAEHDIIRYKIKIKVGNDWYVGEQLYSLNEAIKKRDEFRKIDGH